MAVSVEVFRVDNPEEDAGQLELEDGLVFLSVLNPELRGRLVHLLWWGGEVKPSDSLFFGKRYI